MVWDKVWELSFWGTAPSGCEGPWPRAPFLSLHFSREQPGSPASASERCRAPSRNGQGLMQLKQKVLGAPNPQSLGVPRPCPGRGALGLQTIPAPCSSGPPGGCRRDCWTIGGQEAMSAPTAMGRQASGPVLEARLPRGLRRCPPVWATASLTLVHPALCLGTQGSACPDGLCLPLHPSLPPPFPGPPPCAGGKGPGSAGVAYARGHPAAAWHVLSALAHAMRPGT